MNERNTAIKIIKKLKDYGFSAYMTGGYVRDSLLGLESKDIDIACSAPPCSIESIFEDTDAVGKHFGVIIVKMDGFAVEVATYRKDIGGKDGRHPDSVEFCGIEEDSKRRDFTINAMYMDENGNILDFHNGQEDLKNGIIRFVGDADARCREDLLRILRALRFAARYDFSIEEKSFEAIKDNGHKILTISSERIYNELKQILESREGRILFTFSNLYFDIFGDHTSYNMNYNDGLSFEGFIAGMFIYIDDVDLADLFKFLSFESKVSAKVQRIVKAVKELRVAAEKGEADLRACVFYNYDVFDEAKILEGITEDFPAPPESLVTIKDLLHLGYQPSRKLGNTYRMLTDLQYRNPHMTKEDLIKCLPNEYQS